jgi:hypothetical protein
MASTAFDTDGVRPSHDVSKEFDVEKSINPMPHSVDGDGSDKTDEEARFQPGVLRVRAITEIWTKQTLIVMFILYITHSSVYLKAFTNCL